MSDSTPWDRRLSLTSTAKNLIGHTGTVLLRRLADRVALTPALAKALPTGQGNRWRERPDVLIDLTIAIALEGRNLSDTEHLNTHQASLMGTPASDSTLWRTLAAIDEQTSATIAQAQAKVRRHVWNLLALRPGGFPTVEVAGKKLTGWTVLDTDTTIITASSDKEGAAPTFKKTYGFHPLATWCANTDECPAMQLRPGNAGSNTVGDHVQVLTQALAQVPGSSGTKILVRIDGAGTVPTPCWSTWKVRTPPGPPCATPSDGPSPARTRKPSPPCPSRPGKPCCTRTAPWTPSTRSPSWAGSTPARAGPRGCG